MGRNIFKVLSNPRLLIVTSLGSIITFILGIIIAVIVANSSPNGYNLIDNYISNLGSSKFTPAPFIFNGTCMITAVLLFCPILYFYNIIRNVIAEIPSSSSQSSKMRIFSALGCICTLFAVIGIFMIGIYNEEHEAEHVLFAAFGFGGLMIGGVFYGLLIALYPMPLPKWLGYYMCVGPIAAGILTGFSAPPSRPFWEWISLFAVMAWLFYITYFIVIDAKKRI